MSHPDSIKVMGRTTLVDTVPMGYGRPRGDAGACPMVKTMTYRPAVTEPGNAGCGGGREVILILCISPHHSHHLRSHHLSLPLPFTPDLKLISFTDPLLYSHSYSFRTDFTVLNLYCIKGALALFVLVSFSGYVC